MMIDLENNNKFKEKWFDLENQGQTSRSGTRK